ncbi:DUF4032 domain-containing protein [Hyalangium rubrum]|uniref:DUF4032 domain-containing protein n=1 Tax=Hyalangium rubrum TaxID=3103134 RepID=A0ABU5GX89_9BACT|nr:DUF4032 domain-containing protein [Hyalangium sp. s54d21]MDY7225646.1 DUF4032 domain-containing protein [Hyalangium sp. s54d21]
MPPTGLTSIQIRQGHPDFLDMPWHLPLEEWDGKSPRLVEVPRGLSRHEVRFVSYGKAIYALKELPTRVGQREYAVLRGLEERELPAVVAVGLVKVRTSSEEEGGEEGCVLITRFLDGSLPYRTLFMNQGLERYRERLLDAMASLLVRMHLGGFYWGDCSLSNTLFRRDAGELQAYVVDAETSELHDRLSDGKRLHDLDIMEENVAGGLADLASVVQLPAVLDVFETGPNIRKRYERLWEEINKEIPVAANESYRIHERIRALNDLGFSVDEVDLVTSGPSDTLRMRTIVTDRNYHRHQLHNLTGIVAEEKQATLLLNEIQELKATLARELNRSTPLSTAAFRWLEERFHPTIQTLQPVVGTTEVSEVYCQVLEHKWFLSEREKKDVGLQRAIEDYMELRKRQKDPSVASLLLGGAVSPSLPRPPSAISEGDGTRESAPSAPAGGVDSPSDPR